ncbi:hypothetical protein BBAD15_g2398 [Beauveria bassiana D1-5]|uniref:Uncharacterized protein n=1 Tax=Beauveria bassiana D1-5 TaxID=1245745 RepID=A0A0A2VVA1_BEABA|nr:hypothetical protein BBAD15_g2398 [Beauveria bassiana D1-5]
MAGSSRSAKDSRPGPGPAVSHVAPAASNATRLGPPASAASVPGALARATACPPRPRRWRRTRVCSRRPLCRPPPSTSWGGTFSLKSRLGAERRRARRSRGRAAILGSGEAYPADDGVAGAGAGGAAEAGAARPDNREKAVFVALFETSRRLVMQWAFWECLDVPSVSALATQILYVYVKTERVAQEFHLETAAGDPDARSPRQPSRSSEPLPMLRWRDALAALQRQPLTSALRACLELDMVWNSVHDIFDAFPFTSTTDDVTTAYTQRHAFAPLFEAWEARYATFTRRVRTRTHRRAVDIDIAALDLRRMLRP